jgi:signal transduction histidine kinase
MSQLLMEKNLASVEEASLIYSSGQIMQRTLNDLHTLARLSKDEITFKPAPLTPLAEQAVRELKLDIDKRNAIVTVGKIPYFPISAVWMLEVIKNLILNALKYSDKKQPRIDIGPLPPDKGFYVKDNGIGIAPEHRNKIFDVFYRAPNSLGAEGTGIGLYLVKKIMDLHHGRITVESAPGEGSTFKLWFSD